MFRAQQNVFDEAVAKATDENLTSENWEYIMDVCDRANANDSGPKDVVAALIKRLAHRNANVQLYTLELANALSQNCGVKVHTELSSRSFTDALLRLANDRNTHQQVKGKILERMHEWTEMFAKDPNLGIMDQAYNRLKSQSISYSTLLYCLLTSEDPNLQPPSKPTKQQITDADRRKEEEELQMALELSVKDKGDRQTSLYGSGSQGQFQEAHQGTVPQQPPGSAVPSGTTAATVSRVRALFDFQPSEPGELQFKKGDVIAVLESVYKDWWKGSLRGQTGIFPLNYVEKLSDPTQEELQREAQMEAEVFAEIKNVEKLLTLLSTSKSETSVRDNDEITTLYHSTLAIRPKLIELIGKYSQRKDDFTQLNEKFIKARRDYETLLEASMSQPPAQPGFGRPGAYNYPTTYPPQGSPQQQHHDQGRYFSPNPQGTKLLPYEVTNNSIDQRNNKPLHAPQNAQQSFYVAGQAPPQHHPPYPPSDEHVESPVTMRPPQSGTDQYSAVHPPSTYEHPPQEIGTSSYNSPTANLRRQSYPPHLQQPATVGQDFPPSGYGAENPYSHVSSNGSQPPYQNQQQPSIPYPAPLTIKTPHQRDPYSNDQQQQQSVLPPHQQAHQAAYALPAAPQQPENPPQLPNLAPPVSGPSSPNLSQSPYPNLHSGVQTTQPHYQAYQPPQNQPRDQGYGSNPNEFYR